MCLIVFAFHAHPDYPLLYAGNRDEFYERPTRPMHRWDTSPAIWAGRDEKAGGTWFGVNEQGTVAALTNIRDKRSIKPNAPSRGEIVPALLTDKSPLADRLALLDKKAPEYNGFNILLGNRHELYHYNSQSRRMAPVKPGVHAISNASLNTAWPKVEQAEKKMRELLKNGIATDSSALFGLMNDRTTYPLDKLPETGLDDEMEIAVSAAFIEAGDYGTRSTTVMKIGSNNRIELLERSFDTENTRRYEEKPFLLEPSASGRLQ